MAAEFVWKTHIIFWCILAGMLVGYLTYYSYLRDLSRNLMYSMQQRMIAAAAPDRPWQISFSKGLDGTTNVEMYYMLCFVFFPFLSRPRFFYYLLGFLSCDVLKNIIKLGLHMPRPLWIWPELDCAAAEGTLAAPSGHTARASFVTTFLVLDLFFASTYAQSNNPIANSWTWATHKKVAIAMIVAGVAYFCMLVYFVFLLGQHSFDQLFIGTQYGLWIATYLHFGWRDIVTDHISYIMHVPKLTSQKANQFMITSAAIWGLAVATIYAEVIYLRATMLIPQEWMAVLTACGKKFPVDPVTGLFVGPKNAFMMPEAQKIGVAFFCWGAYLGLVLFRRLGCGRSPFNHYDHGRTALRFVFSIFNYFGFRFCIDFMQQFDKGSSLVFQIVADRMIPITVYGITATCILPGLCSRMLNFPKRILDEKYAEGVDEDKYLCEQPNLLDENEARI